MSEALIRIRIGPVELTCSGGVDREQLDDVLAAVRDNLGHLMDSRGPKGSAPTPAELLGRSCARTFGEKAGVAAYWLETHGGRRTWRSADVLDVLREAGEPEPANITDALNQKAKKGLFAVKDRRWRLTGEGRGWVKYHLLGEGAEEGEDGEDGERA